MIHQGLGRCVRKYTYDLCTITYTRCNVYDRDIRNTDRDILVRTFCSQKVFYSIIFSRYSVVSSSPKLTLLVLGDGAVARLLDLDGGFTDPETFPLFAAARLAASILARSASVDPILADD